MKQGIEEFLRLSPVMPVVTLEDAAIAADLAHGVDHGGADSGLVDRDRAHRGGGGGRHGDRHPEAADEQPGEDVPERGVLIERCADQLSVVVTDDGRGALAGQFDEPGHGLSGMSERITALGGTFYAGTTGDRGFAVRAACRTAG